MKKIVLALLTLSIVCGFSAQTFADAPISDTDKALAAIKSRITIPNDYDAFSSDSYTDENGTEYTFLWESDDMYENSINVTVNENGIISNYQHTDNKGAESKKPLVKNVSSKALYASACAYVKQLNPSIYDNLKVIAESNSNDIENGLYTFDIQRYEKDIPVDGNRGYVSVSADGKTLKDFFLTYTTGIDFENMDRIISRDAAQKAYTDKIGFVLCYGSKFSDNNIIAVPLYTINDSYMQYIGAANGEPVKLNDISYVCESPTEVKQAALPYPEAQNVYIRPQINELKGMRGIISEKQAEKIVRSNKIIDLPKSYTLKSVTGVKDSDNNKCFYTLLFNGTKRSDYVEVMLDAKSGEIVNFGRTQSSGKKTITNEQAKELAKAAAAYLAPKHKNDYILAADTQDGVFSFVRTVNGAEFSANQINIYVDMANGNIVWYDYSYNDIKFPSLTKVIPKEKIAKLIFENSDFAPAYVLNCSKQGMSKYDKATLVYKFSDYDVTEYNAFTGKPAWNNAD